MLLVSILIKLKLTEQINKEIDITNSIRQHIPSFVDGVTPKTIDFNTQEELLAIEFVNDWSKDPGFSHYALCYQYPEPNLFMAVFDDGYRWWVIGYLSNRNNISLPEWKPKYHPVPVEEMDWHPGDDDLVHVIITK